MLDADGFKSYEGFQVIKFTNMPPAIVDVLENDLLVDIWDVTVEEDDGELTVVAAVSDKQLGLMAMGDEFDQEVVISDLAKHIRDERARLNHRGDVLASSARRDGVDPYFDDFRTYDEIHEWYDSRCNSSSICSREVLGETYGRREIWGITINRNLPANAPKIFWECQIHAREWISAPTCSWQFDQLLLGHEAGSPSDADVILDNFIVMIVPVVNPDGYAYSWTNDRMWRKNRRPSNNGCTGIDLNRNWPSHWVASSNGCSDSYPGTAAASEAESSAIGSWIESAGNVQFMIDFHAYGELILRPWGYSVVASEDEATLQLLGNGMRDAIRTVHNNAYVSQRSAQLYPANGETTDYYYDVVSVNGRSGSKTKGWGFTFELRGSSFVISEDEIIPQGEEIWAGMVYAANFTLNYPPQ